MGGERAESVYVYGIMSFIIYEKGWKIPWWEEDWNHVLCSCAGYRIYLFMTYIRGKEEGEEVRGKNIYTASNKLILMYFSTNVLHEWCSNIQTSYRFVILKFLSQNVDSICK